MLFIEALNKLNTPPHDTRFNNSQRKRAVVRNKDSVDLSQDATQVKEIYLDSEEGQPLSASQSIVANLIEHILSYLFDTKINISSPQELGVEEKSWQVFLQIPPYHNLPQKPASNYQVPHIQKRPQAKSLIFHIPVKPAYGNTIEMTVLMSTPLGSPEKPALFHQHSKENNLSPLKTPYTPEFLNAQNRHFHVLLDQDGEPDQLANLHAYANQSRLSDSNSASSDNHGLRIWRYKDQALTPLILGDNRLGLLYMGNYFPLDSSMMSPEEKNRQASRLYEKA
ncbi:hypothetical protein ACUM5Y_03185 [Marinomonas dokdonensis]|uniref:hypothetical protein n=1 Tax=Marinomonas dokdonensis TaxID=328224 RepID=UPI0040559A6D